MTIAWLGELEAHDAATVGGKAAGLSRLASRYRVPPGFALTAATLGHVAPELARGTIPHALLAETAHAYLRLGQGRVAVRSSAIDGDGESLEHGEILVAPTTAPPWTPLFARAAAIVTDAGGILSHCAVVAREYSIPAVVGAKLATAVLRDGQLVEVDGTSGRIRILDA